MIDAVKQLPGGYGMSEGGVAVPSSVLPMPPAFSMASFDQDEAYVPGMSRLSRPSPLASDAGRHGSGERPDCAGRRRFLMGAAAGLAAAAVPFAWPSKAMAAGFWDGDRKLSLYRPRTGERITNVVYWSNGQVNVPGYAQVCRLMRDVKANQTVQISPRLLDLLCAIQSWVAQYGYGKHLQINSGYRNPRTNAGTEGAARNSMHMYACAADIVMPGLPTAYVGKLAQRYAAGGVGFYPSSGFIHVDTGRVRTWRGG